MRFTDKAQLQLTLPDSHAANPHIALLAHASAKAFDQESMHLCVWEERSNSLVGSTSPARGTGYHVSAAKQRLLGEVWLPVTKVRPRATDRVPRAPVPPEPLATRLDPDAFTICSVHH